VGGSTGGVAGGGGGAYGTPVYTIIGNWVSPAPAASLGYYQGNPGQDTNWTVWNSSSPPNGGVGAAPGALSNIYLNTYAPAGPNMALQIMTANKYIYDGGGAPRYRGRWTAGGEGRNYQIGTTLNGGPGPDGRPSAGGGGGGSIQGSNITFIGKAGDGGKGGDALMIIEWWL